MRPNSCKSSFSSLVFFSGVGVNFMPFSRSVISVTERSVEDKFMIFGSMVCKDTGCVGNAGGCDISSVVDVSGRKVRVKNSFVVGCCIVVDDHRIGNSI